MSTASSDGEKVHLATEVDPELKKRIRITAAEEGTSMSAFVRDILEDQMSDE